MLLSPTGCPGSLTLRPGADVCSSVRGFSWALRASPPPVPRILGECLAAARARARGGPWLPRQSAGRLDDHTVTAGHHARGSVRVWAGDALPGRRTPTPRPRSDPAASGRLYLRPRCPAIPNGPNPRTGLLGRCRPHGGAHSLPGRTSTRRYQSAGSRQVRRTPAHLDRCTHDLDGGITRRALPARLVVAVGIPARCHPHRVRTHGGDTDPQFRQTQGTGPGHPRVGGHHAGSPGGHPRRGHLPGGPSRQHRRHTRGHPCPAVELRGGLHPRRSRGRPGCPRHPNHPRQQGPGHPGPGRHRAFRSRLRQLPLRGQRPAHGASHRSGCHETGQANECLTRSGAPLLQHRRVHRHRRALHQHRGTRAISLGGIHRPARHCHGAHPHPRGQTRRRGDVHAQSGSDPQ